MTSSTPATPSTAPGEALLPCPFCGGRSELGEINVGCSADPVAYAVGCAGNACYAATAQMATAEGAVAAWNRRTAATAAGQPMTLNPDDIALAEELLRLTGALQQHFSKPIHQARAELDHADFARSNGARIANALLNATEALRRCGCLTAKLVLR